METRRLRYFAVLAAESSFTAAAYELGITQSALSQQIKRLEQEVGSDLIDRRTNPLTLTSVGERVLRHAREILRGADEIDALSTDVRTGRAGRIRIGLLPSLFHSKVPDAIRQYRRRSPAVVVDLVRSPTSETFRKLRLSQIDAGFTYTVPPGDDVACRLLYRDRMMVVLPVDHAFAEASSVHLAQLRGERFLLPPRRDSVDLHDNFIAACVAQGFSPRTSTVEGTSYTDQIGLVAAGLGVSLLPSRLAHVEQLGARCVPLRSPAIRSPVYLVFDGDAVHPVRDRFIRLIVQLLQEGSEHEERDGS